MAIRKCLTTGFHPKEKEKPILIIGGALYQTDSDSKRDLYSGHTLLSSAQRKTLKELGHKIKGTWD